MEYYCLTQIKPIFKGDGNINKCGRTKTKQFKFGKGHKLEATHAQEIRSKQAIPMHTGKVPKPPERFDNKNEIEYANWKKRADKFAIYILTAFRAKENNFDAYTQGNVLHYNWDALVSWIKKLEEKMISFLKQDLI